MINQKTLQFIVITGFLKILEDFEKSSFSYSAEKEGFEPPEVLPSTVFKTAAIDHSAISPKEQSPVPYFVGANI